MPDSPDKLFVTHAEISFGEIRTPNLKRGSDSQSRFIKKAYGGKQVTPEDHDPEFRKNRHILYRAIATPTGIRFIVQSSILGNWDGLASRHHVGPHPVFKQSSVGDSLLFNTQTRYRVRHTKRNEDKPLRDATEIQKRFQRDIGPQQVTIEELRVFDSYAEIRGQITVTNPDTLDQAIVNGIGRKKHWGSGLLLVQQTADSSA